MYLWDVNALVEDFKEKRVTQRERLKYFLVFMGLVTLVIYGSSLDPIELTAIAIVHLLIEVIVCIVGIILCYKANQRGDDEEFVDRFICIWLPVSIRVGVIYLGVIVFYLMVSNALPGLLPEFFPEGRMSVVDAASSIAYSVIFYIWLRVHISRVSGATA